MDEIREPVELRRRVAAVRCAAGTIGFVPTMGYLHEGHVALMRKARADNELLIVSRYVNPTQFGATEDFGRYPRDERRDHQLAAGAGADILFVPDDETMYPGGPARQQVWIDPGGLAGHLEGAARPGHFRGVATVVAKLLHLVQPDRVYFGQKDGQQSTVIARMIVDLGFPVELHVLPTVREESGLALSSRNVYLSAEQRREAAALSGALQQAWAAVLTGERDAPTLVRLIGSYLREHAPSGRMDYVEAADLATMAPILGVIGGDTMLALAVFFGSTRLIDNGMIRFRDGQPFWS